VVGAHVSLGDGVVSAEEAAAYAQAVAAGGASATAGVSAAASSEGGIAPLSAASSGTASVRFSNEQLGSLRQQAGPSDSKQSDLRSGLIADVDRADANGGGKIGGSEAHGHRHGVQTASTGGTAAASSSDGNADAGVQGNAVTQLLKLLQAYGNTAPAAGSGLSALA